MKDCFRLSLVLMVMFLAPSITSAREFTNSEGTKMTAEVVGLEGGRAVFVREDGKRFRYSLAKLSEADQEYLRQWAKENPSKVATIKVNLEVSAIADTYSSRRSNKDGTKEKLENKGYKITVHNRDREPIEGLVCHYQLFAKLNNEYAKEKVTLSQRKKGKHLVEMIERGKSVKFDTKAVTLSSGQVFKTEGNLRTVGKWREKLSGANFHFYLGDALVATHYIGAFKEYGTTTPAEDREEEARRKKEEEQRKSAAGGAAPPPK